MPVRLNNLHLTSSSENYQKRESKNFAMMGEASSFVDRFHYRKAENGHYCKEYTLPDVTPYSLVYIYTRHIHRCENVSPKTIVI
jgi:hypothetical protein